MYKTIFTYKSYTQRDGEKEVVLKDTKTDTAYMDCKFSEIKCCLENYLMKQRKIVKFNILIGEKLTEIISCETIDGFMVV